MSSKFTIGKKPTTGYRQYPADTVARLRFIKRSQELGFSLKEIEELLALGDGHCREVQGITQQKIQQIDSRLHDLQSMKSALTDMLQQCQRDEDNTHCALIEALTR